MVLCLYKSKARAQAVLAYKILATIKVVGALLEHIGIFIYAKSWLIGVW